MELNDFLILQSLIHTKSVSLTARFLGISQSSVSMKLSNMRVHLKDEILVRKGQSMELTNKAKELIPMLNLVQADLDALLPVANYNPRAKKDIFKLYMFDMGAFMLPSIINKIRSYNDDHIVQAEVIPVVYDKKFGDSFDDADLVIGMNYYLKKFDKEEIYSDQLVLAYKDYPLEGENLSYDDYLQLPHITYILDDTRNPMLDYLTRPDPRNVKITCNSYAARHGERNARSSRQGRRGFIPSARRAVGARASLCLKLYFHAVEAYRSKVAKKNT